MSMPKGYKSEHGYATVTSLGNGWALVRLKKH